MSIIITAILSGIIAAVATNLLAALVSSGIANLAIWAGAGYFIHKKYGSRIKAFVTRK